MGQALIREGARDQGQDVSWLVNAMARMIRPIVRFAIGRVSCAALVNIVRETYIEEAQLYIKRQAPNRKVTTSALALLCGMDGRAIKNYLDTQDREFSPADICSEAQILEAWTKDEEFVDEDGSPADLLVHGPHGTFQRLVNRAAGRAVTPQTALDRLLESGNVELTEKDTRARLIDPVYKPVKASEKTAIETGSVSFSNLGRAVIHNTRRDHSAQASWLQQDRWSFRIPKERVETIRAEIRTILQRHIVEIEDYLEVEEQAPGGHEIVGVGWYYWEDTDHRQAGEESLEKAS
jgi:hypothetical protein